MSSGDIPSNLNTITQFVNTNQAHWASSTEPVPYGLLIYDPTTTILKRGDGVTLYANLPVLFSLSSIPTLTSEATANTGSLSSATTTAATLNSEYSTILADIKTSTSGLAGSPMTVATDLDAAPFGWSAWSTTTANSPVANTSGVLLTISNVGSTTPSAGDWVNQYAYSTSNIQYFRQSVNGAAWTPWDVVVSNDVMAGMFATIHGNITKYFQSQNLEITSPDAVNKVTLFSPDSTGTGAEPNALTIQTGSLGAFVDNVFHADGRLTIGAAATGTNDVVPLYQMSATFALLHGSAARAFNLNLMQLTSADGTQTAELYVDDTGFGTVNDIVVRTGLTGSYRYAVAQGDGRLTPAGISNGPMDLVVLQQLEDQSISIAPTTITVTTTVSGAPATQANNFVTLQQADGTYAPVGNYQLALGFTPVEQGGGGGQHTDKIYIGWSSASQLYLQVDSTNFGGTWPININGNCNYANSTNYANSVGTVSNVPNGAGAVGTYCAGDARGNYGFGNLVSGSNINPYWFDAFAGGGFGPAQTGTWRCMGNASSSYLTLFLRIA